MVFLFSIGALVVLGFLLPHDALHSVGCLSFSGVLGLFGWLLQRGSLILQGCLVRPGSLVRRGCLGLRGSLVIAVCLVHVGALCDLGCLRPNGALVVLGCLHFLVARLRWLDVSSWMARSVTLGVFVRMARSSAFGCLVPYGLSPNAFATSGGVHPSGFKILPSSRRLTFPVSESTFAIFERWTSCHTFPKGMPMVTPHPAST